MIGKSKIGFDFDFAISEQCMRYREYVGFARVYGQHVIGVEYTDDLPTLSRRYAPARLARRR